ESGIDITMRLAGTAFTNYAGTAASDALIALQSMSDGQMDEVHPLRDHLGADLVALVYRGEGCGIGYLSADAASAFSVTDVGCLLGNRTLAHEIGHNQGAHHDRRNTGSTAEGTYNHGFRRCSDGSADDLGSPYFRTVLAYSCSGAARVGRFSNPQFSFGGVPLGVDPASDPAHGAYNARSLNESAAYVAGFRAGAALTPPAAPGALLATAAGPDSVELDWLDNAGDEDGFTIQRATDGGFDTIASLAAETTAFRDDGLTPDTGYQYRLRADNSAGSSDWSDIAAVRTDPAL
ncbi:MAG: zinc-dependent metalloprotease family protein, partial [Xanthomonadales bacterium]|nr:zinc-dependent metalloprotease family protein [Xanthomonadales bacterium]